MPPSRAALPTAWCPKQPSMLWKGEREAARLVLAAGCPNSRSNTTICNPVTAHWHEATDCTGPRPGSQARRRCVHEAGGETATQAER